MESSSAVLARYERFRRSPWDFLCECVFTLDPVDATNPIKLYPQHLSYLYFLVLVWSKKKMIAIPKSRRMTVSWTFIALALWDCVFHKGRNWAFVSKKEDDSAELVRRAEFIYNHIPPEKIPRELLPKMKNDRMFTAPPSIQFSDFNSAIQGYPQGANQLRQFGFSGILGDECAFWEEAQAFYSGAKPTTDGGGKMVLVSSRAPGFFKKIVFDQINYPTYEFPEIPPAPVSKPMEGIETWTNPENGFTVVDLHYTANPEKRGQAWREAVRKSMPIRDFLMEYEKNWETFEGLPVYADFNPNFHVSRERLSPQLGLPLILGWDFGLTPACVVGQLQEDRLLIFREFTAKNMGITRFAPQVMASLRLEFPQYSDFSKDVISFIDPAGFAKKDTNESTCAKELREAGFLQVRPGPLLWEPRKKGVEEFLIGMTASGPNFQIQEENCPILVAGFRGGYRYPDNFASIEPKEARPLKDIHSHPHDALQYLAGGLKQIRGSGFALEIPSPTYGFQKNTDSHERVNQYGRKIRSI